MADDWGTDMVAKLVEKASAAVADAGNGPTKAPLAEAGKEPVDGNGDKPKKRFLLKKHPSHSKGLRLPKSDQSVQADQSALAALALRAEFRRHAGEEIAKVFENLKDEGELKGLSVGDVAESLTDAVKKADPALLPRLQGMQGARESRVQAFVELLEAQGIPADDVACAAGASKFDQCFWECGVMGTFLLGVLVFLPVIVAADSRGANIPVLTGIAWGLGMGGQILQLYYGVLAGGSRGLLRVVGGICTAGLICGVVAWAVFHGRALNREAQLERNRSYWQCNW